MTDRERKAALEALDIVEKTLKGAPAPAFDHWRPYLDTIRAALTPSQMDENVREAVEHFSVEIAAGKWDRDDGREFLETLICAATVQTVSPYKDYTWEDVAMLVQENRALKEAATAQKCEWQTMESAPRDALVFNGQDWFSGYRKDNGVWLSLDPAGGGSCVISPTPTHWMPLPAAPVDKSAEQHSTKGETE